MSSILPRLCCIAARVRFCCNSWLFARTSLCTIAGTQSIRVRSRHRNQKISSQPNNGNLTFARRFPLELPTTVRSMEEHKDGYRPVTLCRTAQRLCAVLVACLILHTADADADPAAPLRHFQLDAGDA